MRSRPIPGTNLSHPDNSTRTKTAMQPSAPIQSILAEASAIITGPRRESYGDVRQSFLDIATLWSVILRHKVTSQDVARCMIAFKLLRETNKPARDNRVDICGYTALLDKLES